MKNINTQINYYVTEPSVYLVEIALKKLVVLTSEANYLEIFSKLEQHPNITELEQSMYLLDISKPNFTGLIPSITQKLTVFKDEDAIVDLKEALLKINSK